MKKLSALSLRPTVGFSTLALMLWVMGVAACGTAEMAQDREVELAVFAAASLADVLHEVGAIYEKQAGVVIVFNLAGSNVLAQQILAAPKADVFVSASEDWMDVVEKAGRIEAGTRRSLLSNTLAVVAHPGSSWVMGEAEELCGLDFRFLAVGDPEAVPAGRYARQWLETLSCQGGTLWEAVAGRVSPAPDARAALGQVEATAGMVGIVYRTDYTAARDRVKLLHMVSSGEGPPIRYSVSRLQAAAQPLFAESFINFLSSDVAHTIFEKHGFMPLRVSGLSQD